MKNLLTYDQFNEQYLPYFGVKQALDDSKNFITNEEKMSDFHRIYTMSPTWWIAWKRENGEDYGIKQDAFSKTYSVSKGGKVSFIFDYGRNKVFTNESPEILKLKKDLSQKEFDKIKDKAEGVGKPKEDKGEKKEKKKEKGADDIMSSLGI
jgi:hypothetical protein